VPPTHGFTIPRSNLNSAEDTLSTTTNLSRGRWLVMGTGEADSLDFRLQY
jgi:hypothetical protein